MNVPSDFKVLGMFGLLPVLGQKHWIAIRELETTEDGEEKGTGFQRKKKYFNLDSNLKQPEEIGDVRNYYSFKIT